MWRSRFLQCGLPKRHVERWPIDLPENQNEALARRVGTGCLMLAVGPRGTGKTQFAVQACAVSINAQWPDKKDLPRYTHAMDLFLRIREAFRSDSSMSEREALKMYTSPKLLVIDEIQERGQTAWEDRMLTYVVDARYAAMKDTILIGNVLGTKLAETIGDSIYSRATECGGLIEFTGPSHRKK